MDRRDGRGVADLYFLNLPFSVTDAFILESLNSGVRASAFLVPGALGAQEGGFVLFGALLGLPADIALVISLSKRVRELALGAPGLVAWQWVEGRRLIGAAKGRSSSPAERPRPIGPAKRWPGTR